MSLVTTYPILSNTRNPWKRILGAKTSWNANTQVYQVHAQAKPDWQTLYRGLCQSRLLVCIWPWYRASVNFEHPFLLGNPTSDLAIGFIAQYIISLQFLCMLPVVFHRISKLFQFSRRLQIETDCSNSERVQYCHSGLGDDLGQIRQKCLAKVHRIQSFYIVLAGWCAFSAFTSENYTTQRAIVTMRDHPLKRLARLSRHLGLAILLRFLFRLEWAFTIIYFFIR